MKLFLDRVFVLETLIKHARIGMQFLPSLSPQQFAKFGLLKNYLFAFRSFSFLVGSKILYVNRGVLPIIFENALLFSWINCVGNTPVLFTFIGKNHCVTSFVHANIVVTAEM